MRKIILTILCLLVALVSFGQLKSEFVIFRNQSSGQLYIKRINHASQVVPPGADMLPFMGIDTSSGGHYTLNWGIDNIDHYVLQTSLDNTTWTDLSQFDQSGLDTTINYTDHAKHYYRVYVVDNNGKSSIFSNVVSAYSPGGFITITMPEDQHLPFDSTFSKFIASAEYSDGTITGYQWSQVSGPDGITINSPNTDTTTIFGYTSNIDSSNVYKFKLKVSSSDLTYDSGYVTVRVDSGSLEPDQFWILDSANFNFTPLAQNIPGYTDVVGDPARNVLTATSPNGITVSTISTDAWGGDPAHDDSASFAFGQYFTTPSDPFNYIEFDSASIVTGFQNYNSEYQEGVYNVKVTGLDPELYYQFILTGSHLGSGGVDPVYSYRTTYGTDDGAHLSMNTTYTTSRVIKLDAVSPNSAGEVELSVDGQRKDYEDGSNGILSALKIYALTTDSLTPDRTYKYKRFYDTMYINDGYRNRLCTVSKPYGYDPNKSYPILMYLAGGESTVLDDEWDPEINVTEGAGFAIQHYRGNVYGLDANGDTSGYILFIPQGVLGIATNESMNNPTVMQTLIDNFKSRTTLNYNDSLYLGAFSRGGVFALTYAYTHPDRVKGMYLSSLGSGSFDPPTLEQMSDFAKSLDNYDMNINIILREDFTKLYTNKLADTLKKYAPENTFTTYWDRDHSGFAWEWTMDTTNFYSGQTVYDWLINPQKGHPTLSKFSLDGASAVNDFILVPTSRYNNQSKTDPNTGFTISTVSSNWGNLSGNPLGSSYYPKGIINYNYDLYRFIYANAGYGCNVSGGYDNGPNITFSGLKTNHRYAIFFNGYGKPGDDNVGVMYYNDGQDSVIVNENGIAERTLHHIIYVDSDASGEINLGFYPSSTQGNGTAYLHWLVIKEY